jgi:outer membrane protein
MVAGAAALAMIAAAAGGASAETLAEALALAYQTNPSLQAQRAQQRILDETYVQARSGYRPSASVSVSASREEVVGREADGGSVALSATQPLYTGGRVSSAVSAAQADILAGRESLRQAEANVLQAVVQAYLDVRRDQQLLDIRRENVGRLQQQVSEGQARFEVGEITRTDVAQAQANLAAARAQYAAAQAQLATSRSSYAAVVGQNPGELAPEPSLPPLPVSVEAAFNLAEDASPALRAAQYAEQASRARIAAARAERLPSVGLRATLGFDGPLSRFSPNEYDRSLTASATVSQPLFAGGVINSQIRQAIEQNNVDRIGVEGARRDLLRNLSQAWSALLAARANISAGEEGIRAARLAYEGTLEERRVGLRTTLEVLSAQQDLRDLELAVVNARRDEYVASAQVLNIMGLLEARSLMPGEPLYDPQKAFNRVKNGGWVPWEPLVATVDSIGAAKVRPLPQPAPTAAALGAAPAPAGQAAQGGPRAADVLPPESPSAPPPPPSAAK